MTSPAIKSVAADSNVLLSAVIGKAARRVFAEVPQLVVVTTEMNSQQRGDLELWIGSRGRRERG